MRRVLVPSTALLWGLQIAFLSPALALVLVSLYGASTAEVGVVLAVYNAGGFVAALVVPAVADRRRDYLGPMLVCGVLTVLLAVLLALVSSLPLVTVVLVVVGGPAGAGVSLLFAHLRHSGAAPAEVINTRAVVSVAWVAGPPVATLVIGGFGPRAVLLVVAAVALLASASTAALGALERRRPVERAGADGREDDAAPLSRGGVAAVVVAFTLLQAGNATVMSIMTVYVSQTLGLPVVWGGVTLGLAAALEVPALLAMGRLTARFSGHALLVSGCVAGVGYFVGLAVVTGPVGLLALQVLNAWSFAAISGVGLTLFQQLLPRPGLATGLYMNTRRVGAIVSGPVIAVGSLTVLAERGIFLTCAALTVLALVVLVAARRTAPRPVAEVAVG